MELVRLVSLPKEPDYPQANEDAFVFDATGRAAAMSDGASESFDSKTWARLICESYIRWAASAPNQPGTDADVGQILSGARALFRADIAQRQLSWSQMAAMARGNFASLVGVRDLGDEIECLAIGDSVVIWARPDGQLRTHVLTKAEEFARNPVLLSSDPRGDVVVFERERSRWSWLRMKKSELVGGYLVLATDAIGLYLLRENQPGRWASIQALFQKSDEELRFWLSKERFARTIRKDDTSFAMIKVPHVAGH